MDMLPDPRDSATAGSPAGAGQVCEILAPAAQTLPLVVASPHSGSAYPPAFVAQSRLDRLTLRRSEDGFVDEIFESAPRRGAPLLRAMFPRAYVDVNREPYELDPAMFADALPGYANPGSPRVAAGLGTIPRIVASGEEIYAARLPVIEALRRIETCYQPYHRALAGLVAETRRRFGVAVVLDCHSMPSAGLAPAGPPIGPGSGAARGSRPSVDFVLGDLHGTSCAGRLTERVADTLRGFGYSVVLNHPYSGGFTTRHYGRPAAGVHALQIEINRALYMDERRMLRGPYLRTLAADMDRLIHALSDTATLLG